MEIKKQDGTIIYGHEITLRGLKIFCTLDDHPQEQALCGEYLTTERTVQVFSDMARTGLSSKHAKYCMPQN